MVLTLTFSRSNFVVFLEIVLLKVVVVGDGTTKYPSQKKGEKSFPIHLTYQESTIMIISLILAFLIMILVIRNHPFAFAGIQMDGTRRKKTVLNISYPCSNQNSYAFRKLEMVQDLEVITLVKLPYLTTTVFSKEKNLKYPE